MKAQISLDDELMKRIDSFADNNYMSRSGLISFATNKFLNESELMLAITNMSLAMKKIADTGLVDHETMESLEDFQRLASLLIGK